jgi:FtsH-binding integral membrane protein
MSPVHFVLRNLMVQSPVLLVLAVGALLAVLFWGRHPRRSLLALLGFVLLLVTRLAASLVSLVIARGNLAVDDIRSLSLVVGVIQGAASTVGFGLLIAALFWTRGREEPRFLEQNQN